MQTPPLPPCIHPGISPYNSPSLPLPLPLPVTLRRLTSRCLLARARGLSHTHTCCHRVLSLRRCRRWAFGCLLWEIAVYGLKPYGRKEGLIDLLKHILHDGLRLEMPAGTPGGFVKLLSMAFLTWA